MSTDKEHQPSLSAFCPSNCTDWSCRYQHRCGKHSCSRTGPYHMTGGKRTKYCLFCRKNARDRLKRPRDVAAANGLCKTCELPLDPTIDSDCVTCASCRSKKAILNRKIYPKTKVTLQLVKTVKAAEVVLGKCKNCNSKTVLASDFCMTHLKRAMHWNQRDPPTEKDAYIHMNIKGKAYRFKFTDEQLKRLGCKDKKQAMTKILSQAIDNSGECRHCGRELIYRRSQSKMNRPELDRYLQPGKNYAECAVEYICGACNRLLLHLMPNERRALLLNIASLNQPALQEKDTQRYINTAMSWFDWWKHQGIKEKKSKLLSREEFLQIAKESGGKCAITGTYGKWYEGGHRKAVDSLSLDRIDSDLPYTLDNVQVCLMYVNFAKIDTTQQEALEWGAKMKYHQRSIGCSISEEEVLQANEFGAIHDSQQDIRMFFSSATNDQ